MSVADVTILLAEDSKLQARMLEKRLLGASSFVSRSSKQLIGILMSRLAYPNATARI